MGGEGFRDNCPAAVDVLALRGWIQDCAEDGGYKVKTVSASALRVCTCSSSASANAELQSCRSRSTCCVGCGVG